MSATPLRCLLGLSAGLLIGRLVAPFATAPDPSPVEEGTPATAAASRPPRGLPSRSSAPDLPDVAACRALLAAAQADDGRHPLLRRVQYQQALRRWLQLDPASALLEAEQTPRTPFARDLFCAWAELDPARALEALRKSGRTLYQAVSHDFLITLLVRDPKLAAEELDGAKWRQDAYGGVDDVYRQWLLSDPAAALAAMKQLPPDQTENDSAEVRDNIMKAWATADFSAAWKAAALPPAPPPPPPGEKPSPEQYRNASAAGNLLASGLLAHSPDALALLKNYLDGPCGERVITHIAYKVADADPRAAADLAHRLEQTPGLEALARTLLIRSLQPLATSDPQETLANLEKLQITEKDGFYYSLTLYREVFASLAAENPAAAGDLLGSVSPAQRAPAMAGYLNYVLTTDPATAESQLRTWFADPATSADAARAWATSFSWGDGSGVRDPGPLLAAFPALQDSVNDRVLSTWAKADPEAAAGWVTQRLTDGKPVPWKESAILADLSTQHPEFTATWLQNLPDPAVQQQAANTLAANWNTYDPAATRRWIDSLPAGPVRAAAEGGVKRQNSSR